MSKSQIKAKLVEIFCKKLRIDKAKITPFSTMNNIGADYLEQIEILMEIENEFSFEFKNYNEMGNINLENFCFYIETSLPQKQN